MLCCGWAPCAPLPVMLMSKNAPPVVHAVDGVAGEAFEQPVLQHLQRAADALFGRLEDEVDGAVEVPRFRQVLGRAQQHRGVAVMAAGVHLAGVLAGVRQVRRFQDRQRVHVGAQADRCLPVAVAQDADDACLADAAMDLDPPFLQLAGHQVGGAVLFQAELGVRVDVAADGGQFVLVGAGAVDGVHGGVRGCSVMRW